jgi:hypothetical protein
MEPTFRRKDILSLPRIQIIVHMCYTSLCLHADHQHLAFPISGVVKFARKANVFDDRIPLSLH